MKNKVWIKKIMCLTLSTALVAAIVPDTHTSMPAQASSGALKVSKFYKMMEEGIGISSADIEKESGIPIAGNAKLTNERAAVIAQAADKLKNKDSYNKNIYRKVVKYKRVRDLQSVTMNWQDDVQKIFTKGIMVGKSNGKCTQDRSFNPNVRVTAAEAKAIIKRVKSKKSRFKLSPDGQVIRTNNLPKTAKKYKYILASFPNSFYDAPMEYNCYTSKVKRGKDYQWPSQLYKQTLNNGYEKMNLGKWMDKYGQEKADLIKKNLEARLSFNYKKSGNAWFNKLRKTYWISGDAVYDRITNNAIRKYMKAAKKNKVSIRYSQITVEPSSAYMGSAIFYRCYIRFKVNSKKWYTPNSDKQNQLIFGDTVYITKMKKNQWCSGYFDVGVDTTAFGQPFGTDKVIDGFFGRPERHNKLF